MSLLESDNAESYFSGIVRIERSDDGLLLHRHTEKQIAYYASANDAWAIRSRCTAGVRLRIETDSPTLDLAGRIRNGARTYAGFDVEADGRVVNAIRLDTSDDTRTLRLAQFATSASRRIDVTFPQSAIVELDAVTVADGASARPIAPQATHYLAIGDSITQGMDARGPASAYPLQLARFLGADLLNLGVGGHIYDLDALDDDLPYRPDVVTVAYGTNDWSREFTREQIADTTGRYLKRLTQTVASNARVYVLTPIWRANGEEVRPGGTLVEFSAAIADAAGAIDGVTVVDGTTLVPHRHDLLPDGTHPNDEGFLHYALNLARVVS